MENNARTFTMGIRGDTSDVFAITDDTAGAFRMSITSSGLVAIGSHVPNRTLDVNGSCSFRSIAYGERFTHTFITQVKSTVPGITTSHWSNFNSARRPVLTHPLQDGIYSLHSAGMVIHSNLLLRIFIIIQVVHKN